LKRIIGIIFLCVIVLSGCIVTNNYYSRIEKKDISDLNDTQNIEFVYEYKGHTDNWAAVYFVYKLKDNDNHTSKMLLKHIGKQPLPNGELSYKFDTVGGGDGAGSLSTADSKDGIYNLGSSESNGSLVSQNSIVKMQVNWNGLAETIELKPELN
jgi:hypothetical protein